MRWRDYFLQQSGDSLKFWQDYLTEERRVLFVLGYGFDPRMNYALEHILKNNPVSIDCALINFAKDSERYATSLELRLGENKNKLEDLMQDRGEIDEKILQMITGQTTMSRGAARIFTGLEDLEVYTDVIIDISALPMSVYFPLLGSILSILDNQPSKEPSRTPNLHVITTENPQIDDCISKPDLADDAAYLYGFTGNIDMESVADDPLVWIPILGEGKARQIEQISDHMSPREICPVLPFPSADPQRGDRIMLEYRDLSDRLRIEISNIIYGSEQNPFEMYRQIYRTIEYYRDVLSPLGCPRFAISPLSSKLTSMGAFLVAYEEWLCKNERVGIAYVESGKYDMAGYDKRMMKASKLFSMWISGDAYVQ